MLAALVAAATCLAAAGCSAAHPAPSGGASPAAAGWPVGIDSTAVDISVTSQGVIAVTPGFTKFPPQVYRFGIEGGEQARQGVDGSPNDLGVGPDGAVWIAATSHPDMASGTGIQVLDPATLRPRREVALPAPPLSVGFVGDEAWVGMSSGIEVLDARRLTPKRTLPLRTGVYGVVADPADGVVVAVEGSAVESLDARTGRRLAQRPFDAVGSLYAVLAGGGLWVGWPVDGGTRLRRFDLPALRSGPSGPDLGVRGAALAGTANAVWVADHGGRLLCLDPATGTVRSNRPLPSVAAVAATDRYVFVGDSQRVERADASC